MTTTATVAPSTPTATVPPAAVAPSTPTAATASEAAAIEAPLTPTTAAATPSEAAKAAAQASRYITTGGNSRWQCNEGCLTDTGRPKAYMSEQAFTIHYDLLHHVL